MLFSDGGVSVPSFLRDRHVYLAELPLCFRVKFFMAAFANADKLPFPRLWVPNTQGQIRTLSQMLYVMHYAGFSVSFFFVFTTLALKLIQLKNLGFAVFPGLPAVKQIRPSG